MILKNYYLFDKGLSEEFGNWSTEDQYISAFSFLNEIFDDYHAFAYFGLVISFFKDYFASPYIAVSVELLKLWHRLYWSHCKYFVKGMFSIPILDANSSLTLELPFRSLLRCLLLLLRVAYVAFSVFFSLQMKMGKPNRFLSVVETVGRNNCWRRKLKWTLRSGWNNYACV